LRGSQGGEGRRKCESLPTGGRDFGMSGDGGDLKGMSGPGPAAASCCGQREI